MAIPEASVALTADEGRSLVLAELRVQRAIMAAHVAAERVRAAQQAAGVALVAVVAAHGYDGSGSWTLDDEATALTRTAVTDTEKE